MSSFHNLKTHQFCINIFLWFLSNFSWYECATVCSNTYWAEYEKYELFLFGSNKAHNAIICIWICGFNFCSGRQSVECDCRMIQLLCKYFIKLWNYFAKLLHLSKFFFFLRGEVFPVPCQPLILSWIQIIFGCFGRCKWLLLNISLGTNFLSVHSFCQHVCSCLSIFT